MSHVNKPSSDCHRSFSQNRKSRYVSIFANSIRGVPEKRDWLKAEDVAKVVVYMASAPKHMLIDEIVLHPLIQQYPIA
jgi:NADP-dependent 3-hydroxy acid dehydrogenase YdfG